MDAVTVKSIVPALSTLPINNAAERPTGVSEIWRNAARRFSAVKWGVAGRILWAWLLTMPLAGLVAVGCWLALRLLGYEQLGLPAH